MIEHIVLLKLSPSTTNEQKVELIRRTLLLKDKIPGIIDIQQGFNFSTRNQGFDVGLTVRFENQTSLENYLPHPAHLDIKEYLDEIGLVDIIVVDFEI